MKANISAANVATVNNPDSKVRGANMGPTWVLSAPDRPHVGPMNLAIRECLLHLYDVYIGQNYMYMYYTHLSDRDISLCPIHPHKIFYHTNDHTSPREYLGHCNVRQNEVGSAIKQNKVRSAIFDNRIVNSKSHCDVIWRHRSGSTSAEIMARCRHDGTKPLPEPMLTHHQRYSFAFTWKQFHKRCS